MPNAFLQHQVGKATFIRPFQPLPRDPTNKSIELLKEDYTQSGEALDPKELKLELENRRCEGGRGGGAVPAPKVLSIPKLETRTNEPGSLQAD